MNFMLRWDAQNMDIHSFIIQFRYKPLITLRRPHTKSREKKFRPSNLGKKIDQQVAEEKKLTSSLAEK